MRKKLDAVKKRAPNIKVPLYSRKYRFSFLSESTLRFIDYVTLFENLMENLIIPNLYTFQSSDWPAYILRCMQHLDHRFQNSLQPEQAVSLQLPIRRMVVLMF